MERERERDRSNSGKRERVKREETKEKSRKHSSNIAAAAVIFPVKNTPPTAVVTRGSVECLKVISDDRF